MMSTFIAKQIMKQAENPLNLAVQSITHTSLRPNYTLIGKMR